jgi:hypothetical protein
MNPLLYLPIGILAGAYFTNKWFHHAIHWTLIKFLQGIIWILEHTDSVRKPRKKREPKRELPEMDKGEMSSAEFVELMKKNNVQFGNKK